MKQKYLKAIFIALFALALLMAGFFAYRAYFTPEALKRREVAKWVQIIGASVELPRSESPTLAAVTNRNKLDGQAFFKDAEQGDIVLIYPQSGRAYLYRPGTGMLIGMTTDVDIEKNE